MKRILLAFALLFPCGARAQFLQNVTTADYSLRTFITQNSATEYTYSVQFRNEQLFSPTRVFGVLGVGINGLPVGGGPTQYVNSIHSGFIGAVSTTVTAPTARFNPSYPNDVMSFNLGSMQTGGGGPGPIYTGVDNGDEYFGLLGCTGPLTFGRVVNFYGGSTCSTGGLSGWFEFNFGVHSDAPYTASGVSAVIRGQEYNYAGGPSAYTTFNVLPEPSTWALLAAGLAAIAGAKRTRDRKGRVA